MPRILNRSAAGRSNRRKPLFRRDQVAQLLCEVLALREANRSLRQSRARLLNASLTRPETQQLAMMSLKLEAAKGELKAINAALDDPRTDLTMTAVEVIHALKAERQPMTPVDLHQVLKKLLRETYSGKPSYYNEEQIDAGCSERAAELEQAAQRLGIRLYVQGEA